MRRLLAGLFAFALALTAAWGQAYPTGGTAANPLVTTPAPGSIQSTNAIETCGPFTGTLANVGDSVTANCPGASGYIVQLVPAAGGMTGTIASTDATTGGGRLLFKTGVGELDVNSVSYTGSTAPTEYRTVGGGYGQKITLTAVTSGTSTVTILASYNPTTVFLNSAVHTADESAVRAGRGYTVSTSYQTVAAGQNLSIYISNPSTNNLRLILTNRILSCDSTTPLSYFGISSPTVNVPATAATPTNRKTGGAASATTAAYGVATTRPDTSPSNTAPPGGILPAVGGEPTLPLRTLEPGTSYALWIVAPTGLGASAHCVITFVWYEEPTG